MVDLWGVGQLHYGSSIWYRFGRYTWERACMCWPCLRTAVLFAKTFFDHVTKPMVWGHNGYMGHPIMGHIFVFLRNVYCGGYFGRQALRTNKQTKKQTKKPCENRIFSQGAWPMALKFLGSMQHLWPLISHPGLFGVQIQRMEIFRRNGRNHAHFSKNKCIDVLAHITVNE